MGKLGFDAVASAGLRGGKGLAGLGEEEAGALGRALCKFNSFTPDTPVLTRAGLLPIASLTLGQDVLAYNEAKGQNEYQPIQQVFVNQDPQITFLQVDQELVTTTPEHPFYVKEHSDTETRPKPVGHEDLNDHWVGAGHLKIGDKIQRADGGFGVVRYVNTVTQTRTMYNLEVKDAHTFFVGTQGWLVHNCDIDLNKVPHIFGKSTERHGLEGLLKKYGGEEEAFKALVKAGQEHLEMHGFEYLPKAPGVIKDTVVDVGGISVTLRGRVVDGQFKIGTAFIPKR